MLDSNDVFVCRFCQEEVRVRRGTFEDVAAQVLFHFGSCRAAVRASTAQLLDEAESMAERLTKVE